jgi:spoIIIJ-associated protein
MRLEKEELADQANDFVQDLVGRAQLDLKTETEVQDNAIRINLGGRDSELLLTDNARLLYSINHLVNQIFYRRSKDRCNFVVDCNSYRADRTAELELLARKAAEKVRTSRTRISLQPMPSSERRIIHLTLADDAYVSTQSEGSGRFRKVLIFPHA